MTSSSSSSNLHPNSNSNIALHLTDSSLSPLLSTSSSSTSSTSRTNPAQIQSLTTLTSTALSAYNSSLHLNLGTPQRIIVETAPSGPILLHSFIAPTSSAAQSTSGRHRSRPIHNHAHGARMNGLENINGGSSIRGLEIISAAREDMRPLSGTTEGSHSEQEHHDVKDEEVQVPLLVGTVVARSAEQIGEARRAAHRIEIVAHGFQNELMKDTAEVKKEEPDEDTAEDG
ncbi:07461d90-47e9-446d-8306-e8273bf0638e-CDS [Sclerotinia trifoliorum]|uniref:07461d90-47e9-446d-8306-e8273bf0638e-CDS n=1 Tax=Sclerotinia trifoliorum TaxID=28548 RepID=A0A8H2VQT4_9HELO|nr:07461d90-47e9-446d-8306-e8273bf0638e-CDS [Sclerotinia trifoliorum]